MLYIALLILADIGTKWWAISRDPSFEVLGSWIYITHAQNTGVAFSTPLPGISWIVPIILFALIAYTITGWRRLDTHERIGYLLLVTGGSLNAIERYLFGHVTDMIGIRYFAVVNVADIGITLGVALLIWASIRRK